MVEVWWWLDMFCIQNKLPCALYVGCLVTSLASTHLMLIALPSCDNQNVSIYCHMSFGVQNYPQLRTIVLKQ